VLVRLIAAGLLAAALSGAERPLYLKTRTITAARRAEESRTAESHTAAPRRLSAARRHLLVQFRDAPRAEWVRELQQRGATVLDYVPDHGFLVSVAEGANLEGMDLALAEPLRPADKVSPLLQRVPRLGIRRMVMPETFVVEFHRDVLTAEARELVRAHGLAVREHPDLLPNQLLVQSTYEDVVRLSEWDEVAYVFPASRELTAGERVYACPGASTLYGRVGQYTARIGDGWDGPGKGAAEIGYYLGPLASALPRAQVAAEVLRGLTEWSRYASVQFMPASSPNASRSISILFARRAHGDGYAFDGPGGVLAHTFYPSPPNPEPIAGDMHFDDEENWRIGEDLDVFTVALHEAGHALGLGHSDNPYSVMYPYYRRVTALTEEDIAAIRELYAPAGIPETPAEPEPPVEPGPEPPVDPAPEPPVNPKPEPPVDPDPPAPPVAPTLSITVPTTAPTYVSQAPVVKLAGSADHPDGILEVTWRNAAGEGGKAVGTRAWVVPEVPLRAGSNLITVTAVAASGTSASRTITVTYAGANDTTAPSLVILSPASTSFATSAATVVISGRAADSSGIARVTWTDSTGKTGDASGTTSWNTGPIPLRVGSNVITIRAYDSAGNMAWRSVAITRR